MASFWDYLSYGPQNPVLSRVSELGQKTGVQTASKKALTIASEAGKPMREALGYGERYNITQAQAGEIGYLAGSLVTPTKALVGAGMEITRISRTGGSIPGLLTIPGKAKVAEEGSLFGKLFGTGKTAEAAGAAKVGKAAEEAAATKKGLSLATYAKYGVYGGTITGAAIGGAYLGSKVITGTGTAIDRFFGVGDGTPGTPGAPGTPGTPGAPGAPGAGGAGGSPFYPGFDPYAGFWGNLGAGLGGLPAGVGAGLGTGFADIGTGVGGGIVPLALIAGGVILLSGKGKKGKKGKK